MTSCSRKYTVCSLYCTFTLPIISSNKIIVRIYWGYSDLLFFFPAYFQFTFVDIINYILLYSDTYSMCLRLRHISNSYKKTKNIFPGASGWSFSLPRQAYFSHFSCQWKWKSLWFSNLSGGRYSAAAVHIHSSGCSKQSWLATYCKGSKFILGWMH